MATSCSRICASLPSSACRDAATTTHVSTFWIATWSATPMPTALMKRRHVAQTGNATMGSSVKATSDSVTPAHTQKSAWATTVMRGAWSVRFCRPYMRMKIKAWCGLSAASPLSLSYVSSFIYVRWGRERVVKTMTCQTSNIRASNYPEQIGKSARKA